MIFRHFVFFKPYTICFILLFTLIEVKTSGRAFLGDSTQLQEIYRYKDINTTKLNKLEKENYDEFLIFLHQLKEEYAKKENWEGLVHILTELGIDDYINSNFDSAVTNFNRALQVADKSLNTRHPAKAKANYYKSQSYFYLGNAEAALKYGNIALEIFSAYYKDEKALDISIVQRGLGNVYQYLLADYFKAEEKYKEAVEVLEYDEANENKETRLRLYYNLGVCSRKILDYDKALTYSNKALTLISEENNSSNIKELCFAIKANALIELNRLQEATLVLKEAISLNIERFQGKSNRYLVQHFSNLGLVQIRKGNEKEAEYYLESALEKTEQLGKEDNLLNIASININLGNLHENRQDFVAAFDHYQKALEIRKDYWKGKHPTIGLAHEQIANLLTTKGQYQEAINEYHDALVSTFHSFNEADFFKYPSIEQLKNNINAISLVSNKANVFLLAYKNKNDPNYLDAALHGYNLADTLVSFYQDIYTRESTKLNFIELYHNLYENGIYAAYELYAINKDEKFLENAFYLMEHSKAKLLTDSFKKARLENELGMPDSIIQQEMLINQQIAYYQQEQNSPQIEEKLFELDREKENLNEYLKNHYPSYYSEKFRTQTFTLKSLQSHLKSHKQLLSSYYMGRKYLYNAIVSQDTFYITKTEIDIKPYIDVLYEHLQNGYKLGNRKTGYEQFVKNNSNLSEILLGNIGGLSFWEGRNIVISPDNLLSYIPFGVLFTEQVKPKNTIDYRSLPYLIKSCNIQYIYSALSFMDISSNKKNIPKEPTVLAFSYSNHKETGEVSNVRKMMAAIPGAPIELDAIKKVFKGEFLYGLDAQESNFKASSSKYDILHLAVHGTASSQETYGAYLQFRPDSDTDNDGKFYNFELYNLRLQAIMAVLSACESGMGKLNRGEGLLSIGRGFAYAGCKTTLMSLWQVNDNATSAIISEFYDIISKGINVNEALRKAKLEYIRKSDELTAHPSYWAPMVSYGVDVKINKINSYFWLYTSIFAVLAILSIVAIKKAFTSKK